MPRAVGDAAHHRDHLRDLLRVQPGEDLVEQQQLRTRGERARQLEALAPGHRQVRGGLVELRPEPDALGDPLGGGERGRASPLVQVRADRHVLADRLRGERLDDLEGARHARARREVRGPAGHVAPVEADRAGVGPQEAGHQREQRRLARAVRTDQRGERPRGQRELDVLHRAQPAEGLGHARQREQRLSHRAAPRRHPRHRPPTGARRRARRAPSAPPRTTRAAGRSRSAPARRRRPPC